ncbi:YALIA101S02e20032g1_1 [Yarrowia lipolytica]|nr:hypothetical protein YALI2_F00078g [Yarrowia lipolytica]RMI97570.1 hypothetical protein BD777DRAFT_126243 [Yarrowia lipolytica]SEI32542.1 YALIA101S02e20032g1_1 [Yarrowia lipolytica]VBB83351.1 YALIH222S02e29822g1_1 [Yarrowia lipolytica]
MIQQRLFSTARVWRQAQKAAESAPKEKSKHITIYQQFGKPFFKVFAVSLITLKGLQFSLGYLENEEKELAK